MTKKRTRRVRNPRPKSGAEKAYYNSLRKSVLKRIESRVISKLQGAEGLSDMLKASLEGIDEIRNDSTLGEEQAQKFIKGLEWRHREEFMKQMQSSFSLDVNILMPNSSLEPMLNKALSNNVGLIKSIPEALGNDVQNWFSKAYSTTGLDQGSFMKLLQDRFKVADNRAKMITRDQNNKMISALNKARNQQLGIIYYDWKTAGDIAVRDSHVDLNGTRQRWDDPPIMNLRGETGHPGDDIQCRCIAISIIE